MKLSDISNYLGLIRFSHTLFALPFALLSAAMALKLNLTESPMFPPAVDLLGILLGILLCMVTARSAAMGFNRWADRKIDAENPRTASRHLPAGRLSPRNVLIFTGICSLGFVLSTLLFLPNRIPIAASIPVLLFLYGYSFAKRWTVGAHFWLGTALMLAPLGAWVVFRPESVPVPWPPVLLGLAVLFWSAGFDLIYACQDAEVDAASNLYSIPGKYGVPAALRLSAACHAVAVLLFGAISFVYEPFGTIFRSGVTAVAVLLVVEHVLARSRDLVRINVAFFQMNVLVSVGLLVVGLVDLVK